MKRKLLGIALVVAMAISLIIPGVALAANPTVTITVSAALVSIINYPSTWPMGLLQPSDTAYFSANNAQNDTYASIENTSNVAVDIEIQSTIIEGGDYDWTWNATPGDKLFTLKANSQGAPTVYDINVKTTPFTDLTTNLAVATNYTWSMKFQAPTIFDAADAGAEKTATVTLVASRYVP